MTASENDARRSPGVALEELRAAAADCRACDLWMNATQTVFGEGDPHARIMLVGEQPGDAEDVAGLPFVGPAGKLLDRALREAGIERSDVYVTNAVKHFRWSETRGKRRFHKKPNTGQVLACRPWVMSEIESLRPHVIVLMGATAVESLLGKGLTLASLRGRAIESALAPYVIVTVHPSSVLRASDDESRRRQLLAFVADLRLVADLLPLPAAAR